MTTKFDFNLSAKDKLSATIGVNRAGDPYNGTLNPCTVRHRARLPELELPPNYYFGNLGYTRIFSPTILNEFHFVAHRSNYPAG